MYEGPGGRRRPKIEPPPQEKSSFVRGFKNALLGVVGVGALPHAIIAIDDMGIEKFELQDSYEKSLRLAKEEYDTKVRGGDPTLLREDGKNMSFADFLEIKDIPTQEEITALERLITEFKEPVKLHRGVGLIGRAAETEFGKKEVFGAAHYDQKYHGDGHNVFIYPEEHEKDPAKHAEEEKYLTRTDIELIVSELAHATQDEQGKKDKMKKDARENVQLKDRHVAYETPGNTEHEAHSVIEPVLDERMNELRESYRTEAITNLESILPTIWREVPDGFFEGEISYDEFGTFINSLKRAYNERVYGTHKIIDIIDRMPGFDAAFDWQVSGEPPILTRLSANKELYNSLRTFLRPYAGPQESAKEYVERVLTSPSVKETERAQATIKDFTRTKEPSKTIDLKKDTQKFKQILAGAIRIGESRKFTRNTYERMLRAIEMYKKGEHSTSDVVNKNLETIIGINESFTRSVAGTLSDDERYKKFLALYNQ
jgi:hypothetical protein